MSSFDSIDSGTIGGFVPDFSFEDKKTSSHLSIVEKSYIYAFPFFKFLSTFLRNALFLPFFNPSSDLQKTIQWDESYGKTLFSKTEPLDPRFSEHAEVRKEFPMQNKTIEVSNGDHSYRFHTRVFESSHLEKKTEIHTCFIVSGSRETLDIAVALRAYPLLASFYKKQQENPDQVGLRLVVFSYYGNKEKNNNEKVWSDWDPCSAEELSAAPMSLLKAFKENEIQVNSMLCFSLGNVALEGLKFIEKREFDMIPKTLIIERGLPSVWKVGNRLYSFPINYLLYGLSYLTGWNADPESAIVQFFQKMQSTSPTSLDKRNVILIEATKDFYFSEGGAFDPNFTNYLEQTGVHAYRGKFYIPSIADRAHHAMPANWIINHQCEGTNIKEFFQMKPNELLSDVIAKEVFLKHSN